MEIAGNLSGPCKAHYPDAKVRVAVKKANKAEQEAGNLVFLKVFSPEDYVLLNREKAEVLMDTLKTILEG